MFDSIETLCVVADPAPYTRLGLFVGRGPQSTTIRIGAGDSPVRLFFAVRGGARGAPELFPDRTGLQWFDARVKDMAAAVAQLKAAGVVITQDIPESAILEIRDKVDFDFFLRAGSRTPDAATVHDFPLKRLDHLAAVAHDLDAKCRFWEEILRVPITGEVVTPTMVIRQLKIGDAIFELLGPAGPDSPLHQRPAGLVSMAAWEVDDLPAAVAQARAAGFTVPDPAVGVLPGTRTATIPAAELGGVAMQLLQYV